MFLYQGPVTALRKQSPQTRVPSQAIWGDAEWEVGAAGRRLSFVVACARMRPPDSHGQVGQSFNQTPYLPLQSSTALPHL